MVLKIQKKKKYYSQLLSLDKDHIRNSEIILWGWGGVEIKIPGKRNYKGNLLFSISGIAFPLYLFSARNKNNGASQ